MSVRYGGGRPVRVRGAVTGKEYRFSGGDRVQLVDPRDAALLLRHPLFRVDGVVELTLARTTFGRASGNADA